jgi:Ca2+-binding EF-hand superfamily protein
MVGVHINLMNTFVLFYQLGDGKISVLELKNALNTIDDDHSDDDIKEMINKADPSVDGNTDISYSEFMGVRA